jgi:uncharacterized membrane protein YeaQ/YmgE (transglycosylase-associated protein family)
MHLSNESLLVIIVVGLLPAEAAERCRLRLRRSGILIVPAFALVGDWLPRLNIHLGSGIVALIVNAFIGAIVLLLVLRLIGEAGTEALGRLVNNGHAALCSASAAFSNRIQPSCRYVFVGRYNCTKHG